MSSESGFFSSILSVESYNIPAVNNRKINSPVISFLYKLYHNKSGTYPVYDKYMEILCNNLTKAQISSAEFDN